MAGHYYYRAAATTSYADKVSPPAPPAPRRLFLPRAGEGRTPPPPFSLAPRLLFTPPAHRLRSVEKRHGLFVAATTASRHARRGEHAGFSTTGLMARADAAAGLRLAGVVTGGACAPRRRYTFAPPTLRQLSTAA